MRAERKESWTRSAVSLNLRNTSVTQKAPPAPTRPSTVKYWLSDNGPLVECIYYASVVDNPPKWASKRWLVDVSSNFLSSPCFTTTTSLHLCCSKPGCISDKQPWTCRTRSVRRWAQDGGDKGHLLMNRPIRWFRSIRLPGIMYFWECLET